MWAGCQTKFLDTLKIGDQVKKRSSVIDVNLKNGKSGLLCFVKAKYEFFVDKKLVIEELHDIVYRDFDNNQATKVIKNDLPLSNPDFEEVIFAHPTMLFRYSAITFNGHRIHYDYPYSTQVEGYQDLVFHGPLQATLMLRASEKFKNTRAKSFSHKGIAPVFANENLHISIEQSENGNVNCFTSTSAAGMTMKAEAVF
jgi:3-methylfumaryl-CoA hydratase